MSSRVAILGAGLTGLSAAWFLKKKGVDTVVFESSARPGGVIRSERREGFLIEHGPNSALDSGGLLADLLLDLGLATHCLEANPQARKRFIVRDHHPVPAPLSLASFVRSPLLSSAAKLRLLLEPFQPRSHNPNETLAEFATRRLGPEAVDYLLNPFVSGIYAGTPETLSVRHAFPLLWNLEQQYGSLALGLWRRPRPSGPRPHPRLLSFPDGLQTLTDTLAREIPSLRLQATAREIAPHGKTWQIDGEPFEALISTIPAHRLPCSNLKLETAPLRRIAELPYAPVTVWHFGFRRDHVAHPLDGFGVLVPAKEPFQILGALFSSTLFPGRAPAGQVLLTVFVGGLRHPELVSMPLEKSRQIALDDLHSLLGLSGEPAFTHPVVWPQAIPQYQPGHERHVEVMTQLEMTHPGLFFAGSSRDGISLPNCLKGGLRAAEASQAFLQGVSS